MVAEQQPKPRLVTIEYKQLLEDDPSVLQKIEEVSRSPPNSPGTNDVQRTSHILQKLHGNDLIHSPMSTQLTY